MGHKQLTQSQRYHIYGLWRAGYKQSDIAKEVGVHKSTISREFNRNVFWWNSRIAQYKPDYAQSYCQGRHKSKQKAIKFTKEVQSIVSEKISQDWSPEQISGYGKKYHLFSISHEWIYRFILKDKQMGGKLYLHLRHQNKKYRKRYGSPPRKGPIKNRIFIDDRPSIVNEKMRIGDWEIDTIVGKDKKKSIITIVERVSKKMICKKIECKKAEITRVATINALKPFSEAVFTITGDNGVEFAEHEIISKELNAQFYFAHPYSSWERGLNENTNGLIRQYIKKGSDFTQIDDEYLAVIMDKLNNRPRKSLNYSTPNEIFSSNKSANNIKQEVAFIC